MPCLQEEGLWFWDFEDNKMYYELEDPVRFRVKNVKFSKPPSVQELRNKAGEDDMSGTAAKPIAVMQVSPFANHSDMLCSGQQIRMRI